MTLTTKTVLRMYGTVIRVGFRKFPYRSEVWMSRVTTIHVAC